MLWIVLPPLLHSQRFLVSPLPKNLVILCCKAGGRLPFPTARLGFHFFPISATICFQLPKFVTVIPSLLLFVPSTCGLSFGILVGIQEEEAKVFNLPSFPSSLHVITVLFTPVVNRTNIQILHPSLHLCPF